MLIRRIRLREDGAAAVELAFLLPLLVMLAFGIIQFGTAYNRQQGMQAAVREGGRLAASATTAAPVTAGQIEIRIENSLQGPGGGSGFPAPGGTVAGDVEVQVTNLTSVSDTTSTPIGSADQACPAGAHSVRVVANVITSRQDDYGLVLPLIPGSPFALPMASEAIFRCLGS